MDNRIALITGGASGIGKAMVKGFLEKGCKVIIFDVQDEKAEKLLAELNRDEERVFLSACQSF